ncbi:MAG: hypothetical protein F4Y91_09865 [Gemmatimonadetes bacterium]|nr:hypothetical protein [Gemmatimonadota bacterium]MXY82350.1 hypothetical protein [Gemmatimonadota bacterium]
MEIHKGHKDRKDHKDIALLVEQVQSLEARVRELESYSETAYLLSSPANARRLQEALNEDPSKSKCFDSIKSLRNELGI